MISDGGINMATNAEIKRLSNERKRKQNLIPKYVWIHRDDEVKFNNSIKRMNKARGIN